MSDISGPFSTLIEDWSGVTTTAVIPSGQRRWYNNVTGYNASEVIELVGDGATTIASLLKRQPNTDGAQTLYGVKTFNSTPVIPVAAPTSNTQVANKKYVDDNVPGINFTFDVEDTDSADVAATTPTSPGDGDQWTVVNSGSSGNYVTGLPGSISLGDGKTATFIYDNTNTTWRYEDVIIDEYTEVLTDYRNTVIKYADGRMVMRGKDITTSASRVVTFPEAFVDTNYSIVFSNQGPGDPVGAVAKNTSTTTSGMNKYNTAGANVADIGFWIIEGRWKA